jgi:acyl dehydratase
MADVPFVGSPRERPRPGVPGHCRCHRLTDGNLASWYGRCVGAVYFEDVEIGRPYWGTELLADEQEMLDYGQRFDPWPMHADPDVGDASPFGGLVASGGYTMSLWYLSSHGFMNDPGNEWAFLGGLEWRVQFPRPLWPGTQVRTRLVVSEKRLSSKPGRGVVTHQADLVDRQEDPLLEVRVVCMLATRPADPEVASDGNLSAE